MIQKKAGIAARLVVGIQGGKGVLGERLYWVNCGHSASYHLNGRFRAQSGLNN